MPQPVLAPGQQHQVLGGKLGAERLADRTVQRRLPLRGAVEKKRNIQHASLGQHARHTHPGDERDVDTAKLHALQQLDITAKRRIRELLDRDPPVRALAHLIGKHRGAGTKLRLDRQNIADAQGPRGGMGRTGTAK